ncbi:MAG: glycosyltransferase [Actinomycetota bacterium]|nr:glycosyltransferase [Actinomycetota bacterium]
MRVAVVAEWYPSRVDAVHGVWAHRQAIAARDAGAEVRVIAARRPVPPLAVARRGPRALTAWLRDLRALLAPWELDRIPVDTALFVSPPRPLSYGAWGYWLAPSLARSLDLLHARWPFDVLHAHCVTPSGYAAARWLASRSCGWRSPAPPRAPGSRSGGNLNVSALVVSAHGPDVISVHARSPFARKATRVALETADLVVANSSWAAIRCEAIAGHELPTAVVHLGADIPGNMPVRHKRRTIVTLGHLVARKRHAVVLHALAAIPESERPDYLVIGDGPGREPLARLARELGLAQRVRLVGQLEHQRALTELARCHLFVMASVEEPFGVAYVEAMAAGLPVIAARGEGGPADISAAGAGMVLVAPDDHRALAAVITTALRDPARLEALGAGARQTVARHFTWASCGERTLAAYERALGAGHMKSALR